MREGWTYKTFGDVGSFLRGKSIQKADFVKNGLPCIHYGQIHTKFGVSVDKHISEIPIEVYNKSIIASYGDVIIAITSEDLEGSCKSTAWLGNYDIAVSSHAAVYKHNLCPKFIAYYLRSNSFYYEKQKYARGFKVMEIKTTDIAKIPIPVPPLSEQQRIVSELDLLSSIIEKKKTQLKEYDQLAQSIFYEMFGDPVTNEKGWEVKKLGEVCEYAKTRIKSEAISTNNYVGVDNLLQNCQGKTIATKVPESLGLTEYWKGDVLIGNIRPYLKKNWLATEKGGCNGDVLAIRRQEVYRETINTMFLFKCLSTDKFFDFAMQYAKGEKMPRGDKKEIMKYLIPLPPLSLQQSFASKIEAIERQKALVQQSITETESLFNSRMDYYFD